MSARRPDPRASRTNVVPRSGSTIRRPCGSGGPASLAGSKPGCAPTVAATPAWWHREAAEAPSKPSKGDAIHSIERIDGCPAPGGGIRGNQGAHLVEHRFAFPVGEDRDVADGCHALDDALRA